MDQDPDRTRDDTDDSTIEMLLTNKREGAIPRLRIHLFTFPRVITTPSEPNASTAAMNLPAEGAPF